MTHASGKKKHSLYVDPDGNKVILSEENEPHNGGRASPTKLTE